MLRRITGLAIYYVVTTDLIQVKAQLEPSQAIARFYVYGLLAWTL